MNPKRQKLYIILCEVERWIDGKEIKKWFANLWWKMRVNRWDWEEEGEEGRN